MPAGTHLSLANVGIERNTLACCHQYILVRTYLSDYIIYLQLFNIKRKKTKYCKTTHYRSQLGTATIAKQPHTRKGGTPPHWTESIYILCTSRSLTVHSDSGSCCAVVVRDSQTHGFGTCSLIYLNKIWKRLLFLQNIFSITVRQSIFRHSISKDVHDWVLFLEDTGVM